MKVYQISGQLKVSEWYVEWLNCQNEHSKVITHKVSMMGKWDYKTAQAMSVVDSDCNSVWEEKENV